jgi:hypothetical protein
MTRPLEFGGIEGVERLAGLEEDVVGDVDHVVDRAVAGGGNRLLQPRGAGADLDVGEMRRGVIRAEFRRAEAGGPGRERWRGRRFRARRLP